MIRHKDFNRRARQGLVIMTLLLASAAAAAQTGSTECSGLVMDVTMQGNAGSGDCAPFWLTSNRQGLSPVKPSGAMLDINASGHYGLNESARLRYGIEMATACNYQSNFYLQQIYADASYKWLNLSVGAKERWGELVNPRLSSGALTWSGNSRPVPQVRLEVPEFARLGILGGWFSLKGHLAYGRYTDDSWRHDMAVCFSDPPQYTDKVLHHSKSLFLKVGDPERFPLEMTFGLEMYAMFGGTRHNMRTKSTEPVLNTYEFPQDARAYAEILLPFNLPGHQTQDNGNTLGSWHLTFDYTADSWKYRIYYEHYYEDHSSMLGIENKPDMNGERGFVFYGFRQNWFDGLFGFEVNAPDGLPFRNAVLELLNTRGQCGSVYKFPTSQIPEGVDGCDAMYFHEFYRSYAHWGYNNGSPVLLSSIYNSDHDQAIKSYRVLMFHLGVDGRITDRIDYRLMATHTSHWGTFERPFTERGEITSAMIECLYRMGGPEDWRIGLSAAADFGTGGVLNEGGKGIMITVSKLWKLL